MSEPYHEPVTAAVTARAFDRPDDRLVFPNGRAAVVGLAGRRALLVTFDPGFRWSVDLAPSAGTSRCQLRHFFFVLSGRMGLHAADGSEREVGPGEMVALEPDHDSWTVGDEPVTFLDIDPVPPSAG